jgi:F-type H+-transporting ATPase subunit delta
LELRSDLRQAERLREVGICVTNRAGLAGPRGTGGAVAPKSIVDEFQSRPSLAGALIEDRFPLASEATGVASLAGRYAAALFELADEQHQLDAVAGDLRELRTMLHESPDLDRLLRSPVLSREEQAKAIAALAERAGLSKLTRDFLGVVAGNRRLFAVPTMIDAYLNQLAERRGEVTAEVTTAQPLNETQQNTLGEQLRRAVGRRVTVDLKVDPSLLGGMIVKVGSRMIDGSLKSRLHRLQLAMKVVG